MAARTVPFSPMAEPRFADQVAARETVIAIVGLGYVGLPLAMASATRCVLPYIDSYTTTAFMRHLLVSTAIVPGARSHHQSRKSPVLQHAGMATAR